MLASGSLGVAALLVTVATVVSTLAAVRFAETTPFESVVFGDRRSGAIDQLLGLLGTGRAALVVYLLERAWAALIVATALTPVFLWLLGSTAVHAAARLRGTRRPFGPLLVLFGYATAVTRVPADLAALALPPIAGAVGAAATIWLGVIAWRAIASHYVLTDVRALTTLLVAVVLFYAIPLALIVAAAVAILVAAVVLEYEL